LVAYPVRSWPGAIPDRRPPVRSAHASTTGAPSASWPGTGGLGVQCGRPRRRPQQPRFGRPSRSAASAVPVAGPPGTATLPPERQPVGPGPGCGQLPAAGSRHDRGTRPGRPRVPPSRPRTPSAICPWTAGNSRTRRDTTGRHPAKRNSPRGRENPGHGLFSLVVAGVGFEPT